MNTQRKTTDGRTWTARFLSMIAGAVVLLLLASPIGAGSLLDAKLLTPRERDRLNRQARENYDKAIGALDHVDVPSAIRLVDQASQLDAEAVELHFLAQRLAQMRARVVAREEALMFYDVAEQALERVAKIKDLSPLTKHRYEIQKAFIADEKKKLGKREEGRAAFGDAFRKLYAQETYTEGEGAAGEGKEAGKSIVKRSNTGESRSGGAAVAGGGGGGGASAGAGRSEGRREGRRGGRGEGGGRRD